MSKFDYDSWKVSPQMEPKPLSSCVKCGELLFAGEEIYEVDGFEHYCSVECVLQGLSVNKIYLGDEY